MSYGFFEGDMFEKEGMMMRKGAPVAGLLLSLCLSLAGCTGGASISSAAVEVQTAALWTGTTQSDLREHTWEYTGDLTAEKLAEGLSQLTGLDFLLTTADAADGITVDWAANSTLLAGLDDREQKEDFHFIDAESMRWFMMDSLRLTLVKAMEVENIYYTMDGGKELRFDELSPCNVFPSDSPYMGSIFYFENDGRGDLIVVTEDEALEVVREVMLAREQKASAMMVSGEDIIEGEHALLVEAGEATADAFTVAYHYAVTDSKAVFYQDVLQGDGWIFFDRDAVG